MQKIKNKKRRKKEKEEGSQKLVCKICAARYIMLQDKAYKKEQQKKIIALR